MLHDTRAVVVERLPSLAAILPSLATRRVVIVGEEHDRYDHHLNQLAIIRAIHARHGDLAIGMEMFPQDDQPHLDAYIARDIDEKEMLKRTRFADRWGYPARLYAPIWQFARARGVALVALNLPNELVEKVRRKGIAGLDDADRARLPEIDRGDDGYRERLKRVFDAHPGRRRDFERFVEAQLLWDEAMAAAAAAYLERHPRRRMVILAGNGHVAHGSGIPKRLKRRMPVEVALVVQGGGWGLAPGVADYVLVSERRPLPPD